MIFKSKGVGETQKIATDLAQKILKRNAPKNAVVIALEGELGAGKTTFAKGFAKALGVKGRITSPTFVLLKHYKLRVPGYELLFHIDAYRLKDHKDFVPLGVKEIFSDPRNIVLIEWSDRVKPALPSKTIKIHIDHINQTTRKITISG